ncbi:MAG TPA: glycosyltransferase family 10 [Bacteriovoracaceae bacterium]|nr:glycosyltransferase family 10 [Bacteriovoracaceae bacterium]
MNKIFLDPTYSNYEKNNLFNAYDTVLNRDDTLEPFIKLKLDLEEQGFQVYTYDFRKIFTDEELAGSGYISLGNMQNLEDIKKYNLRPLAFFIMEPPLVLIKPYKNLAYLSNLFEKVFIHNLEGDCYSLQGVKVESLRKFYWPQPYPGVVNKYWEKSDRKLRVVIINGHHRPKRMLKKELYSDRIRWGVKLNEYIPVDLFGRGWNKLLSKASLWTPYIFNYSRIKKIYRGPCASKLEVMSQYEFALCFENLKMNGYITEKIFDCFYSGVIPVYLGGEDITKWIPSKCFIDLRNFKSAEVLAKHLKALGKIEKQHYRENAKKFLESSEGQKYVSLYKMIFL